MDTKVISSFSSFKVLPLYNIFIFLLGNLFKYNRKSMKTKLTPMKRLLVQNELTKTFQFLLVIPKLYKIN